MMYPDVLLGFVPPLSKYSDCGEQQARIKFCHQVCVEGQAVDVSSWSTILWQGETSL